MKAPRATEILRDDYGYGCSVDLVRRRLQRAHPPHERPAQRTGYRPAQVPQPDWAERALVVSCPLGGCEMEWPHSGECYDTPPPILIVSDSATGRRLRAASTSSGTMTDLSQNTTTSSSG
jgi:hypothetical protein